MNDKVMALIGLDISNSMLMDVLGEANLNRVHNLIDNSYNICVKVAHLQNRYY